MKRRKFIKSLGAGSSSALLVPHALIQNKNIKSYAYPTIASLSDALTKEGEIAIRLEFSAASEKEAGNYEGRIKVKGASIDRIKSYFFESGEDDFAPEIQTFRSHASQLQTDIIVLWLRHADEASRISIEGKEKLEFIVKELIEQPELSKTTEGVKLIANLLLDKEIGSISLKEVGGSESGDDFNFVIMADPQGGDPSEEGNHPTRMKIHNAWIEDSIRRVNQLKQKTKIYTGAG